MMITMLMIGCGADGGNGNRDGFARSDFSCFKYAKLKKIPRGAADTEPHGSSNVSNPRKSWKKETLR